MKENPLDLESLKLFEKNIYNIDNTLKSINIYFDNSNNDIEIYKSYYSYILDKLKGKMSKNLFLNSIKIKDNKLVLIYNNKLEKTELENNLEEINNIYTKLGYKEDLLLIENEDKKEIKQELNVSINDIKINLPKEEVKKEENKYPRRRASKEPDPGNITGVTIKDNPIKIKTVLGEDNNVTIEGEIFGAEYFESSKSDFKIITLKITDYSDSIYCKVFSRDNDEYKRLCKELSSGTWVKVRGYTKNDQYSRELVLNARDIMKVDHEEDTIEDTASEKRVELHAHTKMSQMDGIADEVI